MIRTVIFDMGKVLVWFDNSIFFRRLAARCGLPEERVREVAHARLALVQDLDRGSISPEEFRARVCAELGCELPYGTFYEDFTDVFTLNETAASVLLRLKSAGYGLILLSNTDPERYAFLRRTFPRIQVFDDVVLSFEVKLLKPDPAIYRQALRRAGSAPEECIFIDDMLVNVEAARAEGIDSVHFRWGHTDLEAELRARGLVF